MANTRAQKTAQNLSTLTTAGDIAYASAAGTPARLGIGSSAQVLTVSGGVPSWATPAGGSTFVGASVYKSANQTISTATQTILSWDSEDFDTNSFHDTSTNNGRFTIPAGKGGKYLIATNLYMTHFSTSVQFYIDIFKNGSLLYQIMSPWMTGYENNGISASAVVNASVADYFELRITQSSTGNATITGGVYNSRASISYLGA